MDFDIIPSGLYKSTPEKLGYTSRYGVSDYHCKNFTFSPRESHNKKLYMVDTYFGEWSIELTEKNVGLFELIFDRNNVVQISNSEYYQLSESKRYHVAVDSGGWTYAKYFKIIGAKPLRSIVKNEMIDKIKFYKSQIKRFENELLNIDTDERYEDEKAN